MTNSEDPPRWSDGTDAPAALVNLLSAAKRDVATDAQLSELGSRLEPMLNPTSAATSTATALKLAAGGFLALLGLAAVLTVRHSRQVAPPAVSARPAAVARAAASSDAGSNPTPGLPALPSPALSAPAAKVDGRASSASAAQQLVPDATPRDSHALNSAQAEASLLERARASLVASPAQALRLAQQHAQQFPRGLLVQEREVIAISALRRLGRTTEAEARAARFEARYPRSLHQPAVERPFAR